MQEDTSLVCRKTFHQYAGGHFISMQKGTSLCRKTLHKYARRHFISIQEDNSLACRKTLHQHTGRHFISMQEDTSLTCRKTLHQYEGRQGKTLIRLTVLTSYYLHLRISYNVDVSKTIISRVLMPQPFLQVAFEEIFGCSSTRHTSFDSRPHHVFSMHWVCATVCGSPKFTLWLTVR